MRPGPFESNPRGNVLTLQSNFDVVESTSTHHRNRHAGARSLRPRLVAAAAPAPRAAWGRGGSGCRWPPTGPPRHDYQPQRDGRQPHAGGGAAAGRQPSAHVGAVLHPILPAGHALQRYHSHGRLGPHSGGARPADRPGPGRYTRPGDDCNGRRRHGVHGHRRGHASGHRRSARHRLGRRGHWWLFHGRRHHSGLLRQCARRFRLRRSLVRPYATITAKPRMPDIYLNSLVCTGESRPRWWRLAAWARSAASAGPGAPLAVALLASRRM